MPDQPQFIPPLDLDHFSEDTRRRLYDILSANLFFNAGVRYGEEEPLPYSAQDAGLQVHFLYGRWVATWTRREVESWYAQAERYEVVRIKPFSSDEENDLGFMLHEC